MKNKATKKMFLATQDLKYLAISAYSKFENSLNELIEFMQDDLGYVAFNDESGYPKYDDYRTDSPRKIVAIKIALTEEGYTRVRIILKDDFDGDFNNGWINPIYHGKYDIYDLFNCLKAILGEE